MGQLTVTSWNCFGIKRNLEFIRDLCHQSSIIALQETLLWPHDIAMTDNIHPDFNSYSKSAMDVSSHIVVGRPHRGLSFMWHKSIDNAISIINYNSDRLLGLNFQSNNVKILFINVYLPYECHSNFDNYCQTLGDIFSITQDSEADQICILGDFNAHPNKLFYNEQVQFCHDHSFIMSDITLLPPPATRIFITVT